MIKKIIIISLAIFLSSPLFSSIDLNKRITLNLKRADVVNVLTSISKTEKINIVIPNYVKGNITIFLDNVSLKNALKIITNSIGCDYYINDNIIFIDKINKVQKFLAKQNFISKVIHINFSKAKDLEPKIQQILSPNGKVFTDERTNTLIVTDFKENIQKIEKLIKQIDVPTKQVMIEAKIVIVRDDFAKEFGIQWGGSIVNKIKSDKVFYGISGGAEVLNPDINDTPEAVENEYEGANDVTKVYPPGQKATEEYSPVTIAPQYVVNAPVISKPIGGIGLIFGKWGYYNLVVKLNALKTKNLAKEISSPKVLALNNEKASIEQGLEIPYKTVSESGTNTEFKDAKLKLEVTPHITENNMISLDITLTKDSIGQMTTDGPAINTQEVKTKLLLKNGETAVIGGILTNSQTKKTESVPFFGDLPLLGMLFKNSINQNTRGELLIFLTPRIVKHENF